MKTTTPPALMLASLFDDHPEAVALFDRDGMLLCVNAAAGNFEAAVFDELFATGDPHLRDAFDRALSGQSAHVDAHLEVHTFPARIDGEVCGVFVQVRDAGALHQSEETLRASQERLRSLFEYHPDAIATLDADGIISRVNVALESLTGYFGEKLIGKTWSELVAPESRHEAEEALRDSVRGEAIELDTFLLDRLGNRIDVQMKIVPLVVSGDAKGAYMIAKDVTMQRAAEQAVAVQSERIRQLYLAASARGGSIEAQIDDTLSLGCRLFGFDYGYVTRFSEKSVCIINVSGEGAGVPRNAVYQMENSLSRHVSGERSTLFIPDLAEEPWRNDPARRTAPWRSYYATRLTVNDEPFGALVFAARRPHSELSDLDRDLLQMMALFVAAALERMGHAVRIEQLAFYDGLTGLPNRVLFDDRVKQTIGAAKRYGRGFAVMYLDLDDFKNINDSFGHPTGDRVLCAVADRLTTVLRESDTVARFGGDEFVVLQPVVNGASDAADLARKIVGRMQEPLQVDAHTMEVHTTIGIALYPADGTTPEELMENADRALYRAKGGGRNRWMFYSNAPGERRPLK